MPFLRPKALASLVESAVSTQSILLGRAVHAHVIKTLGLDMDAFLSNYLIKYSKLDLPLLAQLVLSYTQIRWSRFALSSPGPPSYAVMFRTVILLLHCPTS
ncbi:unnamed protein product [Fraxinus pennsylvanica]|uniref:Uncharacterized protein n=1 Tax=Fraxinus pennsylvanica TaxID=56036 RepID=A0AAD2E0Z2_9LAMI|nr:unnamed protein product [Fraxinus pennsylvanica]